VMSRVSLGHTGRPLELPAGMVCAFWLVQCAVVLRLLTLFALLPWRLGIGLAAAAWVAAFALFLWRYAVLLCLPRLDGRPG